MGKLRWCRGFRAAGVVAVAAVVALGPAVPAGAAAEEPVYVALGDSAAAGPLIPLPDLSAPGCARSLRNWPSVVAAALGRSGAAFRDVTCSGAVTGDMAAAQSTWLGPASPQFDALGPDTDLVTVQIGGNDVGLVGVAMSCLNLLPAPLGRYCSERYTAGGVDQVADRIDRFAPTFAATLAELRRRAPHARVFVAGYGTYLPSGGCFPFQPILDRDADYLQASIGRLNAVLAREAAAQGAGYIDLAAASQGHDICRAPGVRWFEGMIPLAVAAPLHPNGVGMKGMGEAAKRHIDGHL